MKGERFKVKPGIITALKQQKNNQKRYSIFVDGEFLLGVNGELVVEYDLKQGREVTEELLTKLTDEENLQEAKDAAFKLLAYRERSKQELKDRLAQKGFKLDVIRRVIEMLDTLGYIDDREFAKSWVKDRISRGFGPYRVRQQLREKGIKDKTIEKVVEDNYDFELEYELALKLARKKKLRYSGDPNRERWYKLKEVLRRKGFSFSVIDTVLEDVLKEDKRR